MCESHLQPSSSSQRPLDRQATIVRPQELRRKRKQCFTGTDIVILIFDTILAATTQTTCVAMESRNCFTVRPSFISFNIHDSVCYTVFDSATVRTNTTPLVWRRWQRPRGTLSGRPVPRPPCNPRGPCAGRGFALVVRGIPSDFPFSPVPANPVCEHPVRAGHAERGDRKEVGDVADISKSATHKRQGTLGTCR